MLSMKLVFYGAGNMAQAIFKGIINSKKLKSHDIYLTNKSNEEALKNFAEELGVEYSYDDENLLQDADYVFLGSKPYDFEKVAQRIQPYINENNRFISIMAGLPINYIQEQLHVENPIARIMPNTNAQVGHSVTGISFSGNLDLNQKKRLTI